MRHITIAIAAAALAISTPSAAQDQYPLKSGEYVELTGIHIDDGHMLDYANWLSEQWRAGQDYAMAQGWITGYDIMLNTFPREGEPDIYLMTRWDDWETPEEEEERSRMFRQHMQTTIANMEAESGGRAEFRTVGNSMLLRRMTWRD